MMICSGLASTASAVDYSAKASIDAQATHNDNLRMTSNDKTEVEKYLVTPALRFGAATETTTLEVSSLLYFNRYNKSEFNSDDQNLGLAFSHQFENSVFGLNANLVRESTITSELESTGRISDAAQRTERYVASPSWTYTLNDSNQVIFQGTYLVQDYRGADYTGYKNAVGGVDWVHIATERIKLIASLSYSDYQSDDISYGVPNGEVEIRNPLTGTLLAVYEPGHFGEQSYSTRTKDKGIQLGAEYLWSENVQLKLRIGRTQNETSYPLDSTTDFCSDPEYIFLKTSPIYAPIYSSQLGGTCVQPKTSKEHVSTAQFDWNWSSETHKLNINTSKSTVPTANGYTVDAIRLGSNWSYRLTERDEISASLTLVRNRSVGQDVELRNAAIADRDYQSGTVAYRRQLSEQWSVNASYQLNRQKYTDVDNEASSRVISLGVRYQPQSWHWSR